MKSFVHHEKPLEIVVDPAPRTWVLVVVFVLITVAVVGSILSQVTA